MKNLSIAFKVLQQTNNSLNRFLGPSALGGIVDFGLGVSTNTSSKSAERDGSLMVENLLQILLSLTKAHSTQSHDGFTGVLEVNPQVRPTSLGGLGGVVNLHGVVATDHVVLRKRKRGKKESG